MAKMYKDSLVLFTALHMKHVLRGRHIRPAMFSRNGRDDPGWPGRRFNDRPKSSVAAVALRGRPQAEAYASGHVRFVHDMPHDVDTHLVGPPTASVCIHDATLE